jgi:glycine hydroxymethyltransferase
MHVIAGKAVCFQEALSPSFQTYAKAIVAHAKALAQTLQDKGWDIVSGGTDNHLVLLDLRPSALTGQMAEKLLESVGIVCNKNNVPYDTRSAQETSGIRLGTPAETTRGLQQEDFIQIGLWIDTLLRSYDTPQACAIQEEIRGKVSALCQKYPLPMT